MSGPQSEIFKFRLYIAGDAPNSNQAVANLSAYCRLHQLTNHEIEVVDVFKDPKRALADGIMLTPTLIKISPLPVRKIIGALSHFQALNEAFGLRSASE